MIIKDRFKLSKLLKLSYPFLLGYSHNGHLNKLEELTDIIREYQESHLSIP